MKKSIILQSFICLLAVSCSVRELDVPVPTTSEDETVFYATLESYSEPDTRVYLDGNIGNIKILWDAGDRISIFNKSSLNQEYEFKGATGDNSGEIHRVPNGYFGAGKDLDYICAVYPYQESTTISNSDFLTLTLPEEQTYREKSFGPGANTMVSVTSDHFLRFKNVCGYLAIKLYGGDSSNPVSISSIRLVGNSGEPLSGEATMALPFGNEPTIEMASTARKSIVLNCEEPVVLKSTQDEATIFWLAVPPTNFTDGITLHISDTNGNVLFKEAHTPLSIERNSVMRFSPIEVNMRSAGSISSVSSADETKLPSTTDPDTDNRTFTVTMPTLNRSNLVLKYVFSGDCVMADGVVLESGKTPIVAYKPVTLTVRKGNYGKNYTLIAKNTGLPVVRITTTGFTLTDLEKYMNSLDNEDGVDETHPYGTDYRIWLPDDNGMVNLPGENRKPSGNMVPGSVTVRIEDADGSPGMKDGYDLVYETNTQIKGRGNYTWLWEKRPYALKFDNKKEVLGMPAHKRWILLANWRDRTLLRNDAVFWLSKQSGLPYTVRGQFVELEFNGEYRGNYYLCEQIKIDKNRVNIDEFKDNLTNLTGGYLMEIDSYWDEMNKFESEYFKLKYMFKEPDEDTTDPTTDAAYAKGYEWMENHIEEFERVLKTRSSVYNGDFYDLIDVDSAILFMLVNELSGNRDFFQNGKHSGPHSTYLYKDKDKSEKKKIFMGPGWDFDYETFVSQSYIKQTSYEGDGWRGFTQPGYYYRYMCYNSAFVARVKELWNSKKSAFSGLPDYIDDMVRKISLSEEFDEGKWSWKNVPYGSNRRDNYDADLTFAKAIKRMKDNFDARVSWMNTEINKLSTTTTNLSFEFEDSSEWPTPTEE